MKILFLHSFQTCAGVKLLKCPSCHTTWPGVAILKQHMAVCRDAAPPVSSPNNAAPPLSRPNKSAKSSVLAGSSRKGMFFYFIKYSILPVVVFLIFKVFLCVSDSIFCL